MNFSTKSSIKRPSSSHQNSNSKRVKLENEEAISTQSPSPVESRDARRAKWATIKEKFSTSPTKDSEPTTEPNQVTELPQEQYQSNTLLVLSKTEEMPIVDKTSDDLDMFSENSDEGVVRHCLHVRKDVDATDDKEGYYRPQLGEVLGSRYRIVGSFGKGAYSNVLKAKDLTNDKDVAIKLLRNNEYMKRTGLGEAKLVEMLTANDPDCKYNTIRLLTHFTDREHLCLVFEAMDMNLRQLIHKYGKNIGLGMDAVRVMGRKILKALYHLKNNGVVHADLKPDNMLINPDRTEVKVADLGSAFLVNDEVIETPLLVSRFYRAPEIILGMKYDQAIDMFSYGCCLYEFATGEPLLRSKDNNEHIKLLMEIKGMVPKKLLSKGKFVRDHFDEKNNFLERVSDTVKNKVNKILLFEHSRKIK